MAILRQEDGTPVAYADPPNMATIRRRFGASARAVRAGDGRWVIRVPEGTPPVGVPSSPQAAAPGPSFESPGGMDPAAAAAMDPEAQNEIADLIAEFTTLTGGVIDPTTGKFTPGATGGTLGSDFERTMQTLNAQRPLIEQSYQDQLRNIAGAMSGRGLLRSGIREEENVRAGAERLRQQQDIERQAQTAGTNLGTGLSQAAERALRGRSAIERTAGANWKREQLANFQDVYGGDTSSPTVTTQQGALAPQPIPKRPPVKPPTYREFVQTHGGKSTAALASKWKTRFGPKKVTT